MGSCIGQLAFAPSDEQWGRENEAPRSKLRGILSGIAPKLASPFYRAEALGEGRSSLQSRVAGQSILAKANGKQEPGFSHRQAKSLILIISRLPRKNIRKEHLGKMKK